MATTYYKIDVEERSAQGSRGARALRKEGKIPAVYYTRGKDNTNLVLDGRDFFQAIHSGHHIFETQVDGKKEFVMVKDVQYHPVTDEIIHVDLMGVRMTEKLTISVPIVLEGEAPGVKEGGLLMQSLTALELNCLPNDVPEQVVIDISELGLPSSLSVSDIQVGDSIEVMTAEDMTVVSIQVPKAEVEEPEEVEEEAEEGEEEAEEGTMEGETPAGEAPTKGAPKENTEDS